MKQKECINMQKFGNDSIRKEKERNYIQNKRLVTHYKDKERNDMRQKRLSFEYKEKECQQQSIYKTLL